MESGLWFRDHAEAAGFETSSEDRGDAALLLMASLQMHVLMENKVRS